jgi:hypothetical protein
LVYFSCVYYMLCEWISGFDDFMEVNEMMLMLSYVAGEDLKKGYKIGLGKDGKMYHIERPYAKSMNVDLKKGEKIRVMVGQ